MVYKVGNTVFSLGWRRRTLALFTLSTWKHEHRGAGRSVLRRQRAQVNTVSLGQFLKATGEVDSEHALFGFVVVGAASLSRAYPLTVNTRPHLHIELSPTQELSQSAELPFGLSSHRLLGETIHEPT